MPLSPGAKLGPYEITAPVGQGGMGEVYRARDTRIDRTVALKILGGTLSSADHRASLEREARFIASLNHPHICALHDVSREKETPFLVMEFVQGETLAARLARGPLPPREAVRYSIQIGEALDHAHRHGVVHRDLKPANIMLTKSGVKVLDFGLATLRTAASITMPLDRTPVAGEGLTSEQSLLGTVQYLAPERLEGGEADVASDVFAFGAVMYEMATGRRAFDSSSAAGVIAAVLQTEPPPASAIEPSVPKTFEWVIQKALAKNPDARWQAAGDIVEVLRWIARSTVDGPPVAPSRPWLVPAVLLGAAALGLGSWVAWRALRPQPPAAASLMFSVYPPPTGGFTPTTSSVQSPQFALSPDGRRLAFVASVAHESPQIWVRELNSLNAQPLAATTGAEYPFWSPDSQSLGFFANGSLKRIDLSGGPARVLAAAPHGRGGAWNRNGVIVFAPTTQSGLSRIDAAGGDAVPLTTLGANGGEASHRWPQFLPDDSHFLYFVQGTTPQGHSIHVGSLDKSPPRRVRGSPLSGAFVAPDHLLFILDDALLAAKFDWQNATITGEPVPIVQSVAGASSFYAAFSASETGLLVYASSEASAELTWLNRSGERLSSVRPPSQYADFRLSPGDDRLAIAEVDPQTHRPDIRVLDLKRGSTLRVTYDAATDASPVWSPDGQHLIFRSNRSGLHDLYERLANGTGQSTLLLRTSNAKYPTDWSPDGRTIVFHTYAATTGADVWTMSADGSGPKPLLNGTYDEMQAQLSPDGQWIAYTSFESGHGEIYVRSIADAQRRWQMSAGGGTDPRWRGDGGELFYLSADSKLTAVEFAAASGPGTPKPLFAVSVIPPGMPYLSNYDVTDDGQRFLIKLPVHDLTSAPVYVITNWYDNRRTPDGLGR
jgi:eukaryotic-like serine/threonine-protein kinase